MSEHSPHPVFFDSVKPLIKGLVQSMHHYQTEWKSKGPQKYWSSHDAIAMNMAFAPVYQQFDALLDLLLPLLPTHWGCTSSYTIMQTGLRWAPHIHSTQGQRYHLPACERTLSAFCGHLLGLASLGTQGHTPTRYHFGIGETLAHQKDLLTQEHGIASGSTPEDAYAMWKLGMDDIFTAQHPGFVPSNKTPEEVYVDAFTQIVDTAKERLVSQPLTMISHYATKSAQTLMEKVVLYSFDGLPAQAISHMQTAQKDIAYLLSKIPTLATIRAPWTFYFAPNSPIATASLTLLEAFLLTYVINRAKKKSGDHALERPLYGSCYSFGQPRLKPSKDVDLWSDFVKLKVRCLHKGISFHLKHPDLSK